MDLELKSKKALITGAGHGLGRAAALSLAKEGCAVAIVGQTPEYLARTTDELHETGAHVRPIQADVTDPDDARRMVAEASAGLGGLDFLVTSCGGSSGEGLLASSDEDWQITLDLNLMHTVRSIRAATPFFKDRGGGAIVIASAVDRLPPNFPAQYGTAKAAEIHLATSLAKELYQLNIRINTVALQTLAMFEENREGPCEQRELNEPTHSAHSDVSFGHLAGPEQIGDAITFLLSTRASWITGTTIQIDPYYVGHELSS